MAAYREAMAGFAQMRTMEIWYAHLAEDELMARDPQRRGRAGKQAKAKRQGSRREGQGERRRRSRRRRRRSGREKTPRRRTPATACRRCPSSASWSTGSYRIVSQPPIVVPARDLAATYGMSADEVDQVIREQFRAYRATLQDDRRHLLERFEIVDMARKVVGVGSVGTRAFIVLLQGRDAHDPLFLQVKEATASVLEDHLPKSRYKQPGERVVQGQRMMQAASDIFLGWTKGVDVRPPLLLAPAARHEGLGAGRGDDAGRARVLRRHLRVDAGPGARPIGDPVAIAEYLGDGDAFDQSITDFSAALRRPERARLPGVRRRQSGPGGSKRSKASDRKIGHDVHARPHPDPTSAEPDSLSGRVRRAVPGMASLPESPAPEGIRSLEVRWIFPGQLEAAVAGWFGRFPAAAESQQDSYLLDPHLRGLSVKVRGGRALEVKVYRGSPGTLDVAGRGRGRMQSWQKWSFPCCAAQREQRLSPAGWRCRYRKKRRISWFSLASGPVRARPPGAGRGAGVRGGTHRGPRCAARPGGPWASKRPAPPSVLRGELEATAALVFDHGPAGRHGTRHG